MPEELTKRTGRLTSDQKQLIICCLGLAGFGIGFRLILDLHLEQTSLLFIGLPVALVIVLTILPNPENAILTALKGVTLAIAMSGALLGEGVVCILITAPLFYLIALASGIAAEIDKRRAHTKPKVLPVLMLPLLMMSAEGVRDDWSFSRAEVVTVERFVDAPPSAVDASLASSRQFGEELPTFLRIGFPRPQWMRGEGIGVGDRRVIRFAGGEGEPGNLTFEVVDRAPGLVHFRAVSDESKIAHWLDWKDSTVNYTAEKGGTRVRWTLEYDRRLDPAWYFAPLERYAVALAAEVLIDNLATP